MNLFTHLWKGRADLPKTSDGFSYTWEHVKILARRIACRVDSTKNIYLYVYTDLVSPNQIEKIENVTICSIQLPDNFFDYKRCYGRLLSFEDSRKYVPYGSRIFIDLDMIPGPRFNDLSSYGTAFLYQRMVETSQEQINGGLLIIKDGDLDQLSKEFLASSDDTIAKYAFDYIGSDQAVISGFVKETGLEHELIKDVFLLKKLKFNLFIPQYVSVLACSGRRNPFSFRSKVAYPFLIYT